MEIRSPFDSKPLANIELEDWKSLDQKIQTGRQLHKDFPQGISLEKRVEVLKKLRSLMEHQSDSLTHLAAQEGGKPWRDSQAEIARAINGVELAIDFISSLKPGEIPMGLNAASQNKKAIITKEPIGLVVAISAFNHPLNLMVHQVVTAFAAGCPVIVKPDLRTPLSCQNLLNLIHKSGAPEGWCQIALCENSLAEKLACDVRVNYVSFIGSAKIGWYLKSKLAPGTRCALEHGGIAAALVLPDADLSGAVTSLCKGSFYHAGQVCVSTQRIFVHHSIQEKFTQELAAAAQKLKVGDPLDAQTDVGPIISQVELNRINQWVHEAVSDGAHLICGGEKISQSTYAPTILLNPDLKSKVSTLEIFGPVVSIYSYSNLDTAIDLANDTTFHFQSAVFSANLELANQVASKLNASAVMINEHTAFRVDWMPFAGRDQSGLGIGGISYSILDMLQDKMVVTKF